MRREDLADLTIFMAVAEEGSFTGAARKLGLSQSALSHTIRRLETSLGLRLLTRTTRSVAPTEAGEKLLDTLRPAIEDIESKVTSLSQLRERPAGIIRITAAEHAATTLLWPVINQLVREHPDIKVELDVESRFTDIVAGRYDAGVRLGEALEKDMVAVRVSPPMRMIAVGAPDYFAEHGKPLVPQELAQHRCINLRITSSGGVYAWEFEKDGRELRIKVDGQLTLNRTALILAAAAGGQGIAFIMEDLARPLLDEGLLVTVLEDWSPPFDGYYLYYTTRRQTSAAFRLLVEALRYRA